ncbi:MAG: phosphatase PAP2 family protein [Gemmatimonadales bacterium]
MKVQDGLRQSIEKSGTILRGLGVFLVAGLAIAATAAWAFGEFAEKVVAGQTQAFDDSVLRWMGAHHSKLLDDAMLEITALGTGTVVLMIVAIASLFLVLTRHKYSAILLVVATAGGILLDMVLKNFFNRPRPHIFTWGTNAVSSSFPSGHAMSAVIVYSTVAYLAARLQRRTWARLIVMTIALIVIILISISRLYLGVHYPSDVVAGMTIGFGWAAFCMATLEAIQRFGRRSHPEIESDEEPVALA